MCPHQALNPYEPFRYNSIYTGSTSRVQGAAKARMLSGALVIVCNSFIAVKSYCDIVQTTGNDFRVVSERSFNLI